MPTPDESPQPKLLSDDTAESLKAIARAQASQANTKLSLPEINKVAELIARMAPASDVPSIILKGMSRLPGRRLPPEAMQQDLNTLFKSMDQAVDGAVYGAFFAGPAAVIWAYQNLLKLAGKDLEESFPNGMWQFYVEYALREDTARHTNETTGFDAALRARNLQLTPADRATAWVMAAAVCLYNYNALIENEWRERVHCQTLWEINQNQPEAEQYARLYRKWETLRPYHLDPAVETSYPRYRRKKFDAFLEPELQKLSPRGRKDWQKRIAEAEKTDLPAYQRQMSILAYLAPTAYNETRTPIPLGKAHVGLIVRGHYYLIPVCEPETTHLISLKTARELVTAIFKNPAPRAGPALTGLAEIQRSAWPDLRQKLSRRLVHELDALRYAPILVNCDQRPRELPLAELRRVERGVGDHALTLIDTGASLVFDQSHIFFDGTWGAALAEILTDDAVDWAVHLHKKSPEQKERALAIKRLIGALTQQAAEGAPESAPHARALTFKMQPGDLAIIQTAPRRLPEAAAETDEVNAEAIQAQRKLLLRRNEKLKLTVNDLLVLYRAIHAATYQPEPQLLADLQTLAQQPHTRPAAEAALTALDPAKQVNPAMLIPVDGSQRYPRDRLHPMNYEVPLTDLKLLSRHAEVLNAMQVYQAEADNEKRRDLFAEFDRLHREYLANLVGFSEVLQKAKDITLRGENATTGTMKLLAHLPAPLQRLLQQVPGRFDVLNDIIQGREVFSNVGAVASTSSLVRFITAKEDSGKKDLAWGILTDATGLMRITLRDFRQHVGLLAAIGRQDLANSITRDYLEAYARGLNNYIRDLRRMALATPKSRLAVAQGQVTL
jgi:hypothetical protein